MGKGGVPQGEGRGMVTLEGAIIDFKKLVTLMGEKKKR